MIKLTKRDLEALIRKEVALPDMIDIWTLRAADEEEGFDCYTIDDGMFFDQIDMDPAELNDDSVPEWLGHDQDTATLTDAQRVEVGIEIITGYIKRRDARRNDLIDEWINLRLPIDVEGKTVVIRFSLHLENHGMGDDCTGSTFLGVIRPEGEGSAAAPPDLETDQHTMTLAQLQEGRCPAALKSLILETWQHHS